MKNPFYKIIISLLLVCAIAGITGCSSETPFNNNSQPEITPSSVDAPELKSELNADEISDQWSEETASKISVADSGSTISISQPGDYVLSGTSEDCTIVVNSPATGLVRLILKGVDITSKTSACINIVEADKTIILLAEGTENILTDAANYSGLDQDQEPDACIFSKDDLIINGSGTLTVNANYNNGIHGKDDLYILDGNINLTSVDDGITGKDLLMIEGGIFNIEVSGDGFKATNDTDSGKGILSVSGGSFNIVTGGGSSNSSSNAGNGQGLWEDWFPSEDSSGNSSSSVPSAKALKAAQGIVISDGTFTIDSADDSIHSNGSIEIKGGDFTMLSGDDGIHADSTLTISGGTMDIGKSYEGLEASIMIISAGKMNITSSDDGINIAGGNDQSAMGGRPGENPFASTSSSSVYLQIDGGEIHIDASGDGLDSNGGIYINGGAVYVSGPTNSGNGALDYGTSCEVAGGILLAAGEIGMAQSPSGGQYTIVSTVSGGTVSTGTDLEVTDEDGNIIVSYDFAKSFSHVIISSPDFVEGQTYTVSVDGTDVGSCQIQSTLNYIGSSGNGGFGGGNMHGGGNMPGGGGGRPGGFGR